MTDLTRSNTTRPDRYSPRVEFILTAATVAICALLLLLPQIRGAQAENNTPSPASVVTTHTSTSGNLTMKSSGSGGVLATDN